MTNIYLLINVNCVISSEHKLESVSKQDKGNGIGGGDDITHWSWEKSINDKIKVQ